MTISKQDQLKIKKHLPKGWRKKIAEMCDCTEVLVSYVFNGRQENLIVADAILKLAEKEKARREAMREDLSERLAKI